ncbi:MAG: hypothetical protein Q4C63_04020 [Eubacteriales bacterium]|nr:hypothetical protein [Eubacteriales bacterium]
MAKIRNAKPKNSSGGYDRVLNNAVLAVLMQKVQSTVISNGTELEKLIYSSAAHTIDDLDRFIRDSNLGRVENGVYLCGKKSLKKSEKCQYKGHEPDFLVFVLSDDEEDPRTCNIVELKDGDEFDTKKSSAEHDNLKDYAVFLGPRIPFSVKFYICCFNQNDSARICAGLKQKFTPEEVLTGREFCGMLGIDYDELTQERACEAQDNLLYFAEEAARVPEVQRAVMRYLGSAGEGGIYEDRS